jgi:hypothetical protein
MDETIVGVLMGLAIAMVLMGLANRHGTHCHPGRHLPLVVQ